MPSYEAFSHPRPPEAQPTISLRMEQVVTKLAATHNVDLSQKGATLNLDIPDQHQQWLIGNIDGQRLGITRCLVDKEKGLTADLDMVFEVKPEGWEPVEVIHTAAAWRDYAKNILIEEQGDFNFATFVDHVAHDLEQKIPIPKTTGVLFDTNQLMGQQTSQETEQDELMLPVAKAAKLLGITPHGVNHIIKTGQAKTEKRHIREVIERQREIIFVSMTDLQQYREHNGKLGRPKKS